VEIVVEMERWNGIRALGKNECEFDSFWLEHICFPLHFVARPHSTLLHCPSGTFAFRCNH
jgi:hypothetical protein